MRIVVPPASVESFSLSAVVLGSTSTSPTGEMGIGNSSLIPPVVGFIINGVLPLVGEDVIGGGVVLRGNDVGSGIVEFGNGAGGAGFGFVTGAIVVPNGEDIGKLTGAGEGTGVTLPLLSIQYPDSSKPTQSPSNRFEQLKYGKNSYNEIF
jgi:hypothetical protein